MHVILSQEPLVNRTVDFVNEAGEWLEQTILKTLAKESRCIISLCGGNTPKPLYARLARARKIDWSKVFLTFGDERCVPPEHAESNFRMASEALLNHVAVPKENVLRLEGERRPGQAALRYESQLAAWAEQWQQPVLAHDIFLLGLGEDGHTASLFPDTLALEETERLAMENYVPKFDGFRLTATYRLINEARKVVFLTTGAAKVPVCDAILVGDSEHPAAAVRPLAGQVFWFIG